MVNLGIIVFANDSGLGAQTRRLTEMLKPFRILAINSSGFSKNKEQNWHWYDNFQGYKVNGFPTNKEIDVFLQDLTHVLVCENPLNFHLFSEARKLGIKTFCQSNYEFCDNLDKPELEIPDVFLMPSYWKVEEMKRLFGSHKVIHLPPPINPNEFAEVREYNFARTGKPSFVHIVGTLAAHDRNGTLDLLEALKYAKGDFSLTIKSQHPFPEEYMIQDYRIKYHIGNEKNTAMLYKDFDAMILPRRYGGLSLGCNEALMSGLPVIMTDISPNNQLLPKEWLVKAHKRSEFKARVMIDVFGVSPVLLAQKLDWLSSLKFDKIKTDAFDLGYNNFSETVLHKEYQKLWLQ